MAGEKHMRLTIHGDIHGGGATDGEIWAVNLRQALVFGSVDDLGTFPSNWTVSATFDSHTEADWTTDKTWSADHTGGGTFDPESYLTDYVMPSVRDWIGTSEFSNQVRCLGVNLYPCDTSGNSIGSNVAHGIYTTTYTGTGSGHPLPLENTAVVSWTTNRLGRRGRGRIYTPCPPVGVLDSVGEYSDASVSNLLASSVALIEGMAYHGVGAGAPSVESVVTGPATSGGLGAYTQYAVINGARVGHQLDTQRRRRNKIAERYSSSTISQA